MVFEKLTKALEASLKQNEADLVMAKQNADITKINLDQLKNELDRERAQNASLNAQLDQFKTQERLDTKSYASLKKRVTELEDAIGSQDLRIQTLQDQLKQKQRDLDSEKNRLVSLGATNRSLEAKINEVEFFKLEKTILLFRKKTILFILPIS